MVSGGLRRPAKKLAAPSGLGRKSRPEAGGTGCRRTGKQITNYELRITNYEEKKPGFLLAQEWQAGGGMTGGRPEAGGTGERWQTSCRAYR